MEAEATLLEHGLRGAPVLNEQSTLSGVLTQTDSERVPERKRVKGLVKEAMKGGRMTDKMPSLIFITFPHRVQLRYYMRYVAEDQQ